MGQSSQNNQETFFWMVGLNMRPRNIKTLTNPELLQDFYEAVAYIAQQEVRIEWHLHAKNMTAAQAAWKERQKYIQVRNQLFEEAKRREAINIVKEMQHYIIEEVLELIRQRNENS